MRKSIGKIKFNELKEMLKEYEHFFLLSSDLSIVYKDDKIPNELGYQGFAIRCVGKEGVEVLAWLKHDDMYEVKIFSRGNFIVDPTFMSNFKSICKGGDR